MDPVEFGRRVRRARLRLGLTQQAAAERSGGLVSYSQWRVIEKGGRARYRDLTLRGVERALGWGSGEADVSDSDNIDQLRQEIAALQRRLSDLESGSESRQRAAR
jgi:transcriptional regulator with XRE-family HTH domain